MHYKTTEFIFPKSFLNLCFIYTFFLDFHFVCKIVLIFSNYKKEELYDNYY